tara:strand:- start:1107 stop:1718 length:612 start_codon:yes stop_codon:yes gene_type:complete
MPTRRKSRKKKTKIYKGGLRILGVEFDPRNWGKKQEEKSNNVAGSTDFDPSASPDSPPDATPSSSVSPTPSSSESQSYSPQDFCDRCREAHRNGDCTIGIDDAGSGILNSAKQAAEDALNKTKNTVTKVANDAQKQVSDQLANASLASRPNTSTPVSSLSGGRKRRRSRRKKKSRKSRKSRKGRKMRKTRKGKKRRKSRRRRR